MRIFQSRLTTRQLIGWLLVVVSTLALLFLPLVPFLPLAAQWKSLLAAGLFIFAELTWWLAVLLLGKDLLQLLRKGAAKIRKRRNDYQ